MIKRLLIAIAALAILGCSSGSTSSVVDNAAKLTPGMTETEVTALLGAPTDSKEGAMSDQKFKTLAYISDNTLVSVYLLNGKVESAAVGDKTLFGKIANLGK